LSLDSYAPGADELDFNVPAAVRPGRDAAEDNLGSQREHLPAARRQSEHREFVANLSHLPELGARVHATRDVFGVEAEREALVGKRRVQDDNGQEAGVAHELLLLQLQHPLLETRVVQTARGFLIIFGGRAGGGARSVSGPRGARAERGGADGSRDERERRYGHRGRAGARSDGGTRRGAFATKRQVSKARKNLRGKFGKNLVVAKVRSATCKRGGPLDGRGVVLDRAKRERSTELRRAYNRRVSRVMLEMQLC